MSINANDLKRRALGRGLEALLPNRSATPAAEPPPHTDQAGRPISIPVERVTRNPFQTRSNFDPAKLSELALSIRSAGVVQPIVVKSLGDGAYQLITGERRLLASIEAGRDTIPAIVREVTDEQSMEMTIVENLQRADLNPMEQARAYQRLSQDFRLTQEQMAVRTGKDRATVSNFLRLLKLPESIQGNVEAGRLSFGHARTLLALTNQEQLRATAEKVMALSMSVRQTETYVHGLMNPEAREVKAKKVIEPIDPNVHEAQEKLQRSLGLKVRIQDRKGRGRVIIDYANLEDFDLLLSTLGVDD